MGIIKLIFSLFGIALITKKDLKERRSQLFEELDKSIVKAAEHLKKAEESRKNPEKFGRIIPVDRYVSERDLFIKGQLTEINQIINEYNFSDVDKSIPQTNDPDNPGEIKFYPFPTRKY